MRFLILLAAATAALAQANRGYYRQPALHGNSLVFVAEGDLWQTTAQGGVARRLTTHLGAESRPVFSPDGQAIAFAANYEGPTEIYTIPAAGGLPQRRTYDGAQLATPVSWTPDGKIVYATTRHSGLPNTQLFTIDAKQKIEPIPLAQAAQGVYVNNTLFFTRLPTPGGTNAKRYKGGLAQNLWKWTPGAEATPLTADYPGTSRDPMAWRNRIYFLSDRDGTMNLWSMDDAGKTLRQHTKHSGLDCATPSLSEGRVVYQRGADLHLYDIAAGKDTQLEIELPSDFEQLRERWVKPAEYPVDGHVSWDGASLILQSRGKVFVAPAKQGRFVEATSRKPSRFRRAVAMPDGKNLLTLSTQSGEVELWLLPANGVGEAQQLTTDGKVLRWDGHPSPDGKQIAHQDKDGQLWLLEIATKQQKLVAKANNGSNSSPMLELAWSPDSRWIAYATDADNLFGVLHVYNIETGQSTPVTTNRYNSGSPAWSADGQWLYFISDRNLRTSVFAPWGPRAPDPHYTKTNKIYALALKKDLKFPFDPPTELDKPAPEPPKEAPKLRIEIDLDGIAQRLHEVPVPAGNLNGLEIAGKRLCWASRGDTAASLDCLEINNKPDNKPESVAENIAYFEFSGDRKKLLVRKQNDFHIADATTKDLKSPKSLADSKVSLEGWTFSVIPQEEYKELFLDAWRLHRDYFYDKGMHGTNWRAVQDRYLPLVSRVRDREELNDIIARMISELSAMHSSVGGGELRRGTDQIAIAALGGRFTRDETAGGYVVDHVYQSDPDRPDLQSPLAKEKVAKGDVITAIDGRDTLSAAGLGELLRNRAGKQTLLTLNKSRQVVVKPLSSADDADRRYHEWEYTRRLQAEKSGVGYVHLRAMGPRDMDQWMEHYYPVHDKDALIVDVRHNSGGNTDPWILGKLLRRAWFWWQPRVGRPYANMQFAFRGHLVVLVDERTASDGEAFAEGFRRLGLGPVIGKRTWGGEIWLTGSNTLADRGLASAAEIGVFADGKWLIEGHGVDPDMVVDNLPHATFNGKDAQLEAAIAYLEKKVKEKPVAPPVTPPYPRMSDK